jgi:hypothetical protein
MELSDKQKQRILEEERQRLAEEQYRAQVHRDLQTRTTGSVGPDSSAGNQPLPATKGGVGKKAVRFFILAVLVGILALLWVVRSSQNGSEPYAPSVNIFKHTEKLASGQITVKAGSTVYYRIPVKGWRDIHVSGHFLALGGTGNDIQVVLAEEREFGKWMDGQPAKVYYGSEKTTSGDMDVKLPSLDATYYLCFNNRFSVVSDKTVNSDISLSYSTLSLR